MEKIEQYQGIHSVNLFGRSQNLTDKLVINDLGVPAKNLRVTFLAFDEEGVFPIGL
jgi:hypothetical protein